MVSEHLKWMVTHFKNTRYVCMCANVYVYVNVYVAIPVELQYFIFKQTFSSNTARILKSKLRACFLSTLWASMPGCRFFIGMLRILNSGSHAFNGKFSTNWDVSLPLSCHSSQKVTLPRPKCQLLWVDIPIISSTDKDVTEGIWILFRTEVLWD